MSDGRLCEGRVVVVTGAGRGLGRSHALELAREGAKVVVNDLGVDPGGSGRSKEPARQVTEAIRSAGGEAVADFEDVSEWGAAGRVIERALETFGRLDAVVNNAGIVRSQSLLSLEAADWSEVVGTHLTGHAALAVHAARHWHALAQASGPADWRIVNTTSPLALAGRPGPAPYIAAKGAIAALTAVEAEELCHYGVTVNAIAPAARTRLTDGSRPTATQPGEFDPMDPDNVSPLVAWLCSADSRGVTGRIFEVQGGRVSLMSGWHRAATFDRGRRLLAAELRPVIEGLVAQAPVFEASLPPLNEAPLPEAP